MVAIHTLEQINKINVEQFTILFGEIFEHSPWIAEKAAEKRPFSSIDEAFFTMKEIVEKASYDQQLALILEHPELGKRIKMSSASMQEQSGAGLDSLSPEEFNVFSETNKAYMKKFKFPFIIAVSGKDKHTILQAMQQRLHNSLQQEFNTALEEIYKIAQFRFQAITQ